MTPTQIESKKIKSEDRGAAHMHVVKRTASTVARNASGVAQIGFAYFRGAYLALREKA